MIAADVNSNFVTSRGDALKDRAMSRLAEFFDDYENVESINRDITKITEAREKAAALGASSEELAKITSGINLRMNKMMQQQKAVMDKYGISWLHVKVMAKGLKAVLEAA